MSEVYERLKFFTHECFHANASNEIIFQRILKELDLYLKSYEDENEDSEWDSDEECAAVVICKDLKKVIEEKASLTYEISTVEMGLIAADSNNSRERLNSTLTNSLEGNSSTASPSFNKTISTEETLLKKTIDESNLNENKDKSLYKNVLNKGVTSPLKEKTPNKSGSMIVVTSFTESLEEQKEPCPDTPITPKVAKDNELKTQRIPRRFTSNILFNKRSNSIQSINSNKGITNKKRFSK